MTDVTLSGLCDETDALIDRVMEGEVLTVTRGGGPVAQLVPLNHLPPLDHDAFRRELDDIIDPSL